MLELSDLSVRYRGAERHALNHLSFSVQEGEHAALLGPNGAGKSTLLLSAVGVIPLESGTIRIGGLTLSPDHLSEVRKKAGLVFQNPDNQLFMPEVSQDIAFGPRNFGVPEEEVNRRMEEILSLLGIESLRNRLIHTLSGGEKRLVALAGVLIMRPSLLLLDEPTSYLDLEASRRLLHCLRKLPQTILLTTHDIAFAKAACTRFFCLERGQLKWSCDDVSQLPAELDLPY